MDFAAIDWQRPWLAHLRDLGLMLAAAPDWVQTANQLARQRELDNAAGLPIVFVPQHQLPEGIAYEAHISATGQVPTRDNLHDFFNALIWLRFPQVKRTLNQLQAMEIRRRQTLSSEGGIAGTRGGQRDAATLFDENAAVFISTDASLIDALRRHQWKQVLQKNPGQFATSCRVLLFGHALIEKLVSPYKAITAHVWCMSVDANELASASSQQMTTLDQRLASDIAPGFVSADFSHLPVLGVPGWWSGQDEAFYDDSSVFRPLRL